MRRRQGDFVHQAVWRETSVAHADSPKKPYRAEGYILVSYCRSWWPENPVCEWMVPGTYIEADIN